MFLDFCFIFLITGIYASDISYTVDDDTKLEFYWSSAQGDVELYKVYLAIFDDFRDQKEFVLIGTMKPNENMVAPTAEEPYMVPIDAEDGKKYQLKILAQNHDGIEGPMSEPSIPVWCKLRSPGDLDSPYPGDVDGNLKVDENDLKIWANSWGKKRGEPSFDYRADVNYDESIDVLDLIIICKNLPKQTL
ncbi:hypothetical protein FJZ33_02865 [Candidatus Poribacteria bacterium]|nr:hypothetical protein [Candidatus Poribacteria bacterium]